MSRKPSRKPQERPEPSLSPDTVREAINALETVLRQLSENELTGPPGMRSRLQGAILALRALLPSESA